MATSLTSRASPTWLLLLLLLLALPLLSSGFVEGAAAAATQQSAPPAAQHHQQRLRGCAAPSEAAPLQPLLGTALPASTPLHSSQHDVSAPFVDARFADRQLQVSTSSPSSPWPWPQLPPSPPSPPYSLNHSQGYFQQIGMSFVVAVFVAVVPGTDLLFMVERPSGSHPDGDTAHVAGYFDLTTHRFTYVNTTDNAFCSGLTVTPQGDIVVVGGAAADKTAGAAWATGFRSLRIFNSSTLQMATVGAMQYPRWYPSATLMPGGEVVIMGGTTKASVGLPNNFYEVWDPAAPAANTTSDHNLTTAIAMDPSYRKAAAQVYYPFNYVLPTGHLFTFCAKYGRIINATSGAVHAVLPNMTGSYSSEYPYTGTSVLLPLMPQSNYSVDVVVFGGQNIRDRYSNSSFPGLIASSTSQQLSVFYNASTGNYSFSSWANESIGEPRVMGDATLLPNGKVILLNGAQNGRAGDVGVAPNVRGRADNPAFYAYLFDPTAPSGQKYSIMSRSMIARMYHGSAGLTPDGNVVVTGCDRCWRFNSTLPYSPSRDARTGALISAEYRVEIFYTPFFFSAFKPVILDHPKVIHYGPTTFAVRYTVPLNGSVTGASLVASSTTTHSFNSNQRVVGLVVAGNNVRSGVLTLVGPPTPNIAVPSLYLLFLLNGDAYSKGVWVTLSL